jgi:hypothetical protein
MGRHPRAWTVDAHAHDALSHLSNMTPKKRREWARVFIGARHHGLGGLSLILFSVECSRQVGSAVPSLVALRVVPRVQPRRGRRGPRPAWHVPPTWAPRALGALAASLVLWAVFAPHPRVIHEEPTFEEVTPEDAPKDWLTRDEGTIAVPMPPKRLERQQAPPCDPAPSSGELAINGGCWSRMERRPPCAQFYEHEGRCYVPVREMPRPPTSVEP